MAIDLDRATYFTTLPRVYYVDGAIHERELERVFQRQWRFVCLARELAEPGSYLSQELFGEQVIIVRGADGALHGHLNVCRHRGHPVCAAGRGRVRTFVCPYHRWTYALDGTVLAAPSMPDGEVIDYDAFGLHPVHVEEWHGLVFVCLARVAPEPIGPVLDDVGAGLLRIGPDALRLAVERSYEIDANWKLLLENYLECYHCVGNHPELCATMDLAEMDADLVSDRRPAGPYDGGFVPLRPGARTCSLDGELVSRRLLGAFAEDPAAAEGFSSVGFTIKPALTRMIFHADHGVIHTLDPLGVGRVRWTTRWYVHRDAVVGDDYDEAQLTAVWHATNLEDLSLIEGAQRGVRSSRYVPGPLSPAREPAIRQALATYVALMEGESGSPGTPPAGNRSPGASAS